ncbi:MAG: manganese catalase family protein [Janthinobacterium lividum]
MILRLDELALDLPIPKHPSANDAAAIQELLGGKFGEMSTLMNYTFQSFNFRGRERLRPFYALTSAIAAEEYSHIEAVSYAINLLPTGMTERGTDGPLADAVDARNPYHFLASGQAGLQPRDVQGHRQEARPLG